MRKGLTYKKSGVDIAEGERLVRLIKPLARSTATSGVISDIGGFGAIFKGSFRDIKDPVLVASTDGVGTKLKVAFMTGVHDTIGVDLVAMCVNDIVTSGARPLFFLDYFSTGKLEAKSASSVIKGIARGCREAGCALIGGETAEMPGLYAAGEYDLAGFAVGVAEKKKIISGKTIKAGDSIIGMASSGIHSNGYSLARKVLFERLKLKLDHKPKGLRRSLARELLAPTRIYVAPVLSLATKVKLLGAAHITGGGFTENIPRVLPGGLKAVIRRGSWPIAPIFKLIQSGGSISDEEMFRTFNCGIGMALIVRKRDCERAIMVLDGCGVKAYTIGSIEKKRQKDSALEFEEA